MVGDTVWIAQFITKKETCCSQCKQTHVVYEYKPRKAKINEMLVSINKHGIYEVRYYIDIDDGQCSHYADNLFKTKQECQRHID